MGFDLGEAGEIAVCGVEKVDAVGKAERGDAGIVNEGAGELGVAGQNGQFSKMGFAFGKQHERRAGQPIFEKIQGGFERRGWAVDTKMGDNAKELMQAGPRNGPGCGAVAELIDDIQGRDMKWGILPMGIDEDIGIQGYHLRIRDVDRSQ